MTGFITTSYVSRVSTVPLLVARAGLDEVVRRTPAIVTPDWALRFGQPDVGTVAATVTSGWAQRAAVDVEIDSWSRSRVLVGLRHRSRAVPWWSDSYFAAAHAAVAAITNALEDWADEPLRAALLPPLGLATR